MAEGPEAQPRSAGHEVLEELVYRAALNEDDRALRGASPWLTVPVTLALAAALGGLVFALGRRGASEAKPPESVSVVLNEAPDGPAHAGSAPAPARPAPAPAPAKAPAPAAAPAPEVQPRQPPPAPREEAPPDAVPRELPKEDHSRQYGSSAPAAGSGGTGSGSGSGTGTGTGSGTGTGAGRGGHGKVVDLTFSDVREKSRPPLLEYPSLARMARIQGTVVVQIVVGLDGVPMSARALEGPFQLRASAEAYALGWRFEPYMLDGVAQVSRFSLTVTFRIK